MGGHRVLSASGEEAGLTRARSEHPDLILLDYHMPVMKGRAVVERLKADAATRRIPVVALTSGTAEHANELIRAGCLGFIPKPFEPAMFLHLIAAFLNETAGTSRRPSESPPGRRSLTTGHRPGAATPVGTRFRRERRLYHGVT